MIKGKGETPEEQLKNISKEGLKDSPNDQKLSISKGNDLHFHYNFKSLITVCFEGILDNKKDYSVSFEILMDNIVQNPSIQNKKVFDCEMPSMIL